MTAAIIILIALVALSYAGYPAWLYLLSRVRQRPVRRARVSVPVTVVIAARNEAHRIEAKLENIRQQRGHGGNMDIVVVSDGSTDQTADLVRELSRQWRQEGTGPSLRCIELSTNMGKALALNEALRTAAGDVVVFADVRQMFEPDAIACLLENFGDPAIGAVSGQLRFRLSAEAAGKPLPLGLYWRLETSVRKMQAATGSVMGATGAIYAMRRELWRPLPGNMLVDDLYTPLQVIDAGKRVVFDQRAVAWDTVSGDGREEYRRKVRTLTGVWQCLPMFRKWLREGRVGVAGRFFAHKLSRLLVPWALLLMPVLSIAHQGFYWNLFGVAQICGFLVAALVPHLPALARFGLFRTAHFFLLLNMAAGASLFHAIKGPGRHLWAPSSTRRPS